MNANEKYARIYFCEKCNYKCFKKSCWVQHTGTAKHKKAYLALKGAKEANKKYTCLDCGKNFIHQSSFCRHKRICKICSPLDEEKNIAIIEPNLDKELILMLIKQNNELMDIVRNASTNITNNISNSNCHNKTFNLQLFLNETCKDAMNITDFVDSIKLQLTDLIEIGEVGYVEGISNIIVKNLNALDETTRPIHCTDKKRETIYIKDEGHWEKEDDNRSKLKKVIRKISDNNIKLLPQFREKYPECRKAESNISDKYCKMVIEAMGGMGDNTKEKENKIIRNISKNVVIDK